MISLETALEDVRRHLAPISDSASLDAQLLAAHALGKTRTWILAHSDVLLTQEQHALLKALAYRLENGEALPYVLGHWEFFGLDFLVSPATLIPRPETELLVEHALEWLQEHPGRTWALDVGTGSGCIAISLARHIPGQHIIATDISLPALRVAQRNAALHNLSNQVIFLQCDLFPPGGARFDLICANLPYIPTDALHNLAVYHREPSIALDGGPDGLAVIGRLLQGLPQRLNQGGLALLEIEASQGDSAGLLAQSVFPQAGIGVLPDLAGRARLVRIQT